MKIIRTSLALALLCGSASAVTGLRPAAGSMSMTETITPLGGGMYSYSYTLSNFAGLDSVWWFGVYSTSLGSGAGSGSLPGFYNGSIPNDMLLSGESNVAWTYDSDGLSNSVIGVVVGGTGTLSFEGQGLDSSAKTFFADIKGEWSGDGSLPINPDGTEVLSYLGTVTIIPEPGTLLVLGVGFAATIARRPVLKRLVGQRRSGSVCRGRLSVL